MTPGWRSVAQATGGVVAAGKLRGITTDVLTRLRDGGDISGRVSRGGNVCGPFLKRNSAVWVAVGLALAGPGVDASATTPPARPNIILILADDLGWADPGFHGGDPSLTPNIDRLAREGTRFEQFLMTPVCATTRAALLTGRYPFRTWMDWRSEDFGKPNYLRLLGRDLPRLSDGTPTRAIHGLPTEERTLAEALREAGYETAVLGKWHLGEWLPEHLPLGQGFDHQYGHYGWGIDYNRYTIPHNAPAIFCVYDWHRDQQPVFEQGYATDLIANEAVRLIGSRADDRPFFHYVAFNAIHGPLEEIPRHQHLDKRAAAIRCLDEAVGRIVAAVDQAGLAEETLVIFTNDNGGLTEEVNRPWRGTKNTTYEGGIRVPFVARWPGRIAAGGENRELMHVTDLYPTLVQLAGGSLQQPLPLDGIGMRETLLDGHPSRRTEVIIEASGSVRLPTIRQGRYKLVGKALYDLVTDPGERTDIAAARPAVGERLRTRLAEVSATRPPLDPAAELMEPALPFVYGRDENQRVPDWLRRHVSGLRALQPQTYPPGETPWPQPPRDGKIRYTGDGR